MLLTGLRKEAVLYWPFLTPFFLFLIYYGAQFSCAFEKKEKTKGKGIRKFRLKEKGKEAQPPPFPGLSAQPASPRTRTGRSPPGGSHLSTPHPARPRALALSPFLSAWWGRLVSVD
jgi:hypothetical protein